MAEDTESRVGCGLPPSIRSSRDFDYPHCLYEQAKRLKGEKPPARHIESAHELPPRQRQVSEQVLVCSSVAQIALKLQMSKHGVSECIRVIADKAGVHGIREVTQWVRQHP